MISKWEGCEPLPGLCPCLTEWRWPWQLWNPCTENSSTSNQGPWVTTGNRAAPHLIHLEELSSFTWVRNVLLLCLNHYPFVNYLFPQPKITLTNLDVKGRFQNDNDEQMYEQLEDACGQEKDECIGGLIKLNILRRDLQFRWRFWR